MGLTCQDKPKERTVLKGHTDMVMDLQLLGHTPLLASASLDSKIIFWDMNTSNIHQIMNGHVKGVFSLAYAAEHRLLFSASFDRDVLIWNPMVEQLVGRLKGFFFHYYF